MIRVFLSAGLIILLSGCSFIAKTVYGAKKPQIETEQSIVKWLNDNKLRGAEVVTFDTSGYVNFLPLFATSPLLFETSGKFRAVGFTNGKYCAGNVDKYLSRVNPGLDVLNSLDSFIIRDAYDFTGPINGKMTRKELNKLKQTTAARDTIQLNFFDLNKTFYSLTGIRLSLINISAYDFILVLPFAKFFGSNFQIKDLKKFYNAAINNPNAKFKIIFLNLDKQEWWGKEPNDRITILI